jgi:hypothetical protein
MLEARLAPASLVGGVSVAAADINNDGYADLVTGSGPGSPAQVKVFSGKDGTLLFNFYPFDASFTGGISIAVGDVMGDGSPAIIVGAGPGSAPEVKVFSGKDCTLLRDFFAYDGAFRGGVSVAAGDLNGDGRADIVTGAGVGGGPHVKIFSGADTSLINEFMAYDPASRSGVHVGVGDVNHDGTSDVITGTGPGSAPEVKVFSGKDWTPLYDFYAYDPSVTGGVFVAGGDISGDGYDDIITGSGPGTAARIRVFSGRDGMLYRDFYAYDAGFLGGAWVADPDFSGDGHHDIVTGAGPGGGAHVRVFSGQDTTELASFFAFGPASGTGGFSVPSGPQTPTFDLAAGTADLGPNTTSAALVTLVGQTSPGVSVGVVGTGLTALASGSGAFQIPGVGLDLGANDLTVMATDAAGHTNHYTRTVTRSTTSSDQSNAVLVWNRATLKAIEQDGTDPLFASRGLAMVQAAVFDAVNAIVGTPAYYVHITAPAGASVEAAVDAAAHDVLGYLYPGQQATFDARFASQLALLPAGQAITDGETVGQAAGNAIIAMRANDGSQTFVDFTSGTAPGNWQPTPPAYAEPLDPQWANLLPFALTSPDQFRSAGPPDLTSQQWADAVNQVESLGRATGSTRTADQTQIAQFWNDASGTFTPPGHWNAIAEAVAQQAGNSLVDDARLFAELDVALADAGITAWNTKYFYDTWRPVTVIQGGGDGVNPGVTADPTWVPFLTTPNFPEYVSGHSTFSAAAATVLDAFFGTNVSFSSTEETLPGVVRSFTSFDQAAQEAGVSRIYGGIHFSFSNTDGQTAGKAVANYVLNTFDIRQDTTPPRVILDNVLPSGASKTNVTITGQTTDNLSGVKLLEVQVDQGGYVSLGFNSAGRFTFSTSFALDGSADGPHTINFRATDVAGNVATPVAFTFALSTTAPVLTLTSPTDGATLENGDTLTGTAATSGPALTALRYAFDGGTSMPVPFTLDTGAATPNTYAYSQTLDLSKLAAGDHQLRVTATDAAGNTTTQLLHVHLDAAIPLVVSTVTPDDGTTDVGVTFRPKVTFSRAIDPTTLNSSDFYATDPAGNKLPANIVPSADGTYAWLFFHSPMPGASTITLTVDGSGIRAADGSLLDAAGTGTPGSKLTTTFTTVSLTSIPGTSLSGIVADPGPDLKPMTRDDVRNGPDNVLGTADDVYLLPIAGAKVYIIGLENQAVFTDAHGRFHFDSVPVGDVKLVIDGTTATNAPDGYYFPSMTLDLTTQPGVANTVMGSMGTAQEQAANATAQGVYLPRLLKSILQPVNPTGMTQVHVSPDASPDLTPQQQQNLSISVQGGSLVDENGQPVANPQIGISLVPPQLVMDMLPTGVLQHTLDITIQAPGAVAFTTPATLTFPNIFGAAPGTQLNFLSFDHTTGRLEIDGTATVSADGLSVTTDPGQGITHVGWHGLTPPGDDGKTKPFHKKCPPSQTKNTVTKHNPVVLPLITGESTGGFPTLSWSLAPGLSFIHVTITVDGPLAAFLDQTGSLPLTGADFSLSGVGTKSFGGTANSYDKLLGIGGFLKLTDNQLYGAKITITVVSSSDPMMNGMCPPDMTTGTDISTYYLYRFVDAADDNDHDNTIGFEDTLVGVTRHKPFDLHVGAGAVPQFFVTVGSGNNYTTSGPDVIFKPTAVGENVPGGLLIYTPDLRQVALLNLTGDAVPVQTWYIDQQAMFDEIQAEFPNLNPSYQAIFGSHSIFDSNSPLLFDVTKTNQFIADVISQAEGKLGDYSQGIVRTTDASDSNAVKIDSFHSSFFAGAGVLAASTRPPLSYFTFSPDNHNGQYSVLDLIKNRSVYSLGQQDFILSKALNETLSGETQLYLDHIFQQFNLDTARLAKVDARTGLVNSLGKIIAHELGHQVGMVHTNGFDGDLSPFSKTPAVDIMTQGLDYKGTTEFDITDSAMRVALGMDWDSDQAQDAISYFRKYVAFGKGQDAVPPDGDNGLSPFTPNAPVLNVLDSTGQVHTSVDFGTVTVPGPAHTLNLLLANIGDQPATLGTASIAGTHQFAVTGLTPGQVLAPGAQVPFTVTFTPVDFGNSTATLTVNSNGVDPHFMIPLTATVHSPNPHLTVSSVDNNLGGVALAGGGSAQKADVATITNNGALNLNLTSIQLIEGDVSFTLTGLPADLASNPIVLAPGQSYTFGITYTPSHAGLERARIQVTSNDPDQPVVLLGAVGTGLTDDVNPHWGNDYVAVEFPNQSSGLVLRAVSDAAGNADLFLPPKQAYHIAIFDPVTGLIAHGYGITPPSGGDINLAGDLVFGPSTAPDSDGDGLPNDVEFAIGTSPKKIDSNGNGIDDFTEIIQNHTNPLAARLFPTGAIASLTLGGVAKAITLQGSTTNPQGQTAYVATGSSGLAIVDATQFTKPILLGQIHLPGDNHDVAVDPAAQIAAVAAGNGGLHLVDVSNPMQPALLQTVPLAAGATAVTVLGGLAYVASGPNLVSIDTATGEVIQTLNLGGANLTSLTREGTRLFTLDANQTLRAVDVNDGLMTARGSVTVPAGGGKLFVGNGIVYVGAGFSGAEGFATVDVSDPDHLVVLSGVQLASIGGQMVVANGSGLAVAIGSPALFALGNVPLLDVVDVSNPANTGGFLTQLTLPEYPFAVAIASGIGYVADSTAGLVVVNYEPFDTKGVPPTVGISTSAVDVDPNTPGLQVIAGTVVPIQVNTSDDVQVRNVELLLNGQVVRNQVSFPFDLSVAIPNPTPQTSTYTLQVRATDTGGNSTLSNVVTLQSIRDTVPPTIVQTTPASGGPFGHTIIVDFSKPLNAATVTNATFQLLDPNGQPVSAVKLGLRNRDRTVQLAIGALTPGNYQLVIKAAAVTDRAGNPLGAADVVTPFTHITTNWINPNGGDWNDPTNWSTGDVPGPGDDVVINTGTNALITFSTGTVQINSLRSSNPITITGGSLQIVHGIEVDNRLELAGGTLDITGNMLTRNAATGSLILSGGTLVGGTINASGGAKVMVTGYVTLDGVTLNADLDLTTANASAVVQNGLTLNGTARIGDPNGQSTANLTFAGDQLLSGNGSVLFGSAVPQLFFGQPSGGNTLQVSTGTMTIGSGITIGGGYGILSSPSFSIGQVPSLVNQGTIAADGSNSAITINVASFTNQGTIAATNGGSLSVNGVSGGLGTVRFSGANSMLSFKGTNYTVDSSLSASSGQSLALLGSWTAPPGVMVTATNATFGLGTTTTLSAISLTNSVLNLFGQYTTAQLRPLLAGNTLALIGTGGVLDNTGDTITLAAPLTLAGTLKGGTVNGTGSARIIIPALPAGGIPVVGGPPSSTGTLDGTTLNVDLDVTGANASAQVLNGLTLNATARIGDPSGASTGSLSFVGDSTLSGTGRVQFGTGGGATMNQLGAFSGSGVIISPGISPAVVITPIGGGGGGATLTIGSGITLAGGVGQLSGQTVVVQGSIDVQHLTVRGALTLGATSAVTIEIGGNATGQFSQIMVTGGATLAGTLNLVRVNGYTPNVGDSFPILSTNSTRTGQFALVNGTDAGNGHTFAVNDNAGGVALVVG